MLSRIIGEGCKEQQSQFAGRVFSRRRALDTQHSAHSAERSPGEAIAAALPKLSLTRRAIGFI
jgi:hypothetical protein